MTLSHYIMRAIAAWVERRLEEEQWNGHVLQMILT